MRDDGYEVAVKTAETHYCPDCRGKSRLAVRMVERRAQAWCRVCGRTEGFVRRKSVVQIWRENPDAVPVETANVLEKKYGA